MPPITSWRPRQAPATPTDTAPNPASAPATPHVRQRRRPAVIALAVAMIAVGGLGAYTWVKQGTTSAPVVVAGRDLHPGQALSDADLKVVDVGNASGVAAIPGEQREQLLGKYVRTEVPAGAVLAPEVTAADLAPRAGTAVVGVLAKPGQLPASGLRAGDRVRVVMGVAAGNPAASPIKPGTTWNGIVSAVGERRDSSDVVVDVTLSTTEADAVATVATSGQLSLLRQPVGG